MRDRITLHAAEDKERAEHRLRDQMQRVDAVDRMLAVVTRLLDDEASRARG